MDEIKIPDFMDDTPDQPDSVGENSTKDDKEDFVIDLTKGLEAFLDEAGIGKEPDSEVKSASKSDSDDTDQDQSASEEDTDLDEPDQEEDTDQDEPDLDDDFEEDDDYFETEDIEEATSAQRRKTLSDRRRSVKTGVSRKTNRPSGGQEKTGEKKKKKTAKELKKSLSSQLRERKIPTNMEELNEYIDWDKWNQRKKVILPLVYIALALVLILGVMTLVKYHTWRGYAVSASNDEEDTVSYSYTYVGKNVLRYGIDSARLMDADYNVIWSDSYAMSNPAIEICGNTVCIYDKGGSALITYNQNGRIGSATSELPIVKATVAAQGVAAVICESSTETWIKYYSTDGSVIASFRTDMDSPGYPMDVALSPDGLSMTIPYAFVEAGQINTQVAFYNFGSVGQNLVDNLVKVETYDDVLAPQVEYIQDDTCIVFFEDGFRVFQGIRKPTEVGSISIDQTILSYDASEKGVVLVLRNELGAGYQIKMFTLRGKGIFTGEFDFAYHGMTVESDKILFYNSQELMLYSMAGVRKFEGAIDEGVIKTAMDLGKNRYLLVTDRGIRTIRLK